MAKYALEKGECFLSIRAQLSRMPLTNDKKADSDIKMRMSEYFFCRISSDLSHASA